MNEMPDTTNSDSSGDMYLHAGATDRAVGAVIGSAVGDALGAFYETTYPAPEGEIVMRPGGGFDHGRALGGWTDDTSMALGVLDALAAGHAESAAEKARADDPGEVGEPCRHWDPPPIDVTAMAANFLRWYRGGPPDVGNQTARILGAAAEPEGFWAPAGASQPSPPTGPTSCTATGYEAKRSPAPNWPRSPYGPSTARCEDGSETAQSDGPSASTHTIRAPESDGVVVVEPPSPRVGEVAPTG